MSEAKPFQISKRSVWDAYKRVKANRGAAGVDGETLAAFEEKLEDNLYKLWNRMSSGSYFPPPVRLVEIPKGDGGRRALGIPTVADGPMPTLYTNFRQSLRASAEWAEALAEAVDGQPGLVSEILDKLTADEAPYDVEGGEHAVDLEHTGAPPVETDIDITGETPVANEDPVDCEDEEPVDDEGPVDGETDEG